MLRCIGLSALFWASVLSGCAFTGDYPSDWPGPAAIESGRCPDLEGRYGNAGLPAEPCHPSGDGQWQYRWDCNAALLDNILLPPQAESRARRDVSWVELHQPDEDTLVVRSDAGLERVVLKRTAGDFSCDSRGLTLSRTGSIMRERGGSTGATAVYTTLGLLVGTGAAETLSRSFQRLRDGTLLMEVNNSATGTYLFVPILVSNRYYVRWMPVPPR